MSGSELRAALDAALARESQRCGQPLRWDEREQQHVDAAVQAAKHVEALQQLLDEELGGERRPTTVVKLTSEIRFCSMRSGSIWVGFRSVIWRR